LFLSQLTNNGRHWYGGHAASDDLAGMALVDFGSAGPPMSLVVDQQRVFSTIARLLFLVKDVMSKSY